MTGPATGAARVVGDDDDDLGRLYDVTAAADDLGRSRKTVYRLVEAGVLEHVRVGRQGVRFTDAQMTANRARLADMTVPEGYTVPQVATYLSCSRSQVYKLIGSGALASVRTTHGRRVVTAEQLDAFTQNRGPR